MTALPLPPALRARWDATSPRDRRALGLMALAIGAFVYGFGLLAPLSGWAADARADHARARADAQAIGAVIEAIESLPPPGSAATPATARASAEALGLPVRELDADTLELGPAAPDLVFAWLERQRRAGQLPPSLHLQPAGEKTGVRVGFSKTPL